MIQQPLYIKSVAAISPQLSFDAEMLPAELLSSDNNTLYVADPDYTKFINPVAIRRMSRIIKMGISAGMRSLQLAGITTPDAIIAGTGRGSVTDTERFLNDMISLKEQALNPTYFIQSTYNSINGWLAMQTKCTGYNQTYVHRGFSFELSLMDAQLLLAEQEATNILVGCFDEMSPDYYTVKDKIGYWKKQRINSAQLLQQNDSPGTIGGEGAAFVTVGSQPDGAIYSIAQLHMLQDADANTITDTIHMLLKAEGITADDIDIVLAGLNGDSRQQWIYDATLPLFPNAAVAGFKHLCGEYDTSSGFALWVASKLFAAQQVPDVLLQNPGNNKQVRYIFFLNHYLLNSTTLMLLKIAE